MRVGVEGRGEGGVGSANHNYTHASRRTVPHTAFLPLSSSIRKHIKASRPARAAAAAAQRGCEKQHAKKAREMRARDDGFVLCVPLPLPALQLWRLQFIVSSMHRPRCGGAISHTVHENQTADIHDRCSLHFSVGLLFYYLLLSCY